MKCLIARQGNGELYSLFRFPPIVAQVAGTDHTDVYPRSDPTGDPIGYRNMCPEFVAAALSVAGFSLPRVGDTFEIELFFIPSARMTPQLRKAIMAAQGGEN